jgi:alpha-tubulin suppressor-like RCC1 family protein
MLAPPLQSSVDNMRKRSLSVSVSVSLIVVAAGCEPMKSTSGSQQQPSPSDNNNNSSDNNSPPNSNPSADKELVPLPSAKAAVIAGGRLHACAVTADKGEVRCWGYSDHSQIAPRTDGNSSDPKFSIPVAMKELSEGVKMVSASSTGDHTCAITAAGGVKCWGDDSLGQLGTGIPYSDNRMHESATPLDVKSLSSNVIAISVGDVSSCALLADHTVKCWGKNGCWIGDGNDHLAGDTGTPEIATASDTGLKDIAQVSVGHEHACAVTTAGGVKCWGANTFGEIGIGDDRARVLVPTDVPGLTNVTSVSAGFRTTCARLASGAVKCWGTREYGSIGDGKKDSFDDAMSPVDVTGISSGAFDVFAGAGASCAIVGPSKNVKCWGETKALGTAEGEAYRTYQPAGNVVGLEGVTQVVGGSDYACARLQDGAVKCWGDNGGGMLGNGKGAKNGGETSHEPVNVVSLP